MSSRSTPLITAAMAMLAAAAPGQDQDELLQLRADKLASSFLQKAEWLHDYDAARAQAQQTGKPIFAYFSRSYTY